MIRRLARFRFVGVFAAAAVAGGMILVPTSGTAFAVQTAQTAQTAAATTYISLEIDNFAGINYTNRLCYTYISNLGNSSGYVLYADNPCNGRLWLHRLAAGGGASFCISPHRGEAIPAADQPTESITATTNPNPCL